MSLVVAMFFPVLIPFAVFLVLMSTTAGVDLVTEVETDCLFSWVEGLLSIDTVNQFWVELLRELWCHLV